MQEQSLKFAVDRLERGDRAGDVRSGYSALETLAKQHKVAEHVDLIEGVAAKCRKGGEHVQVSSEAVRVLYNDPSPEAQRAIERLFLSDKVYENVKYFILNAAQSKMKEGWDNRSFDYIQRGCNSKDTYVQGHSMKTAVSLMKDNPSYRSRLLAYVREGFHFPANRPRSEDTITREEYAAIEAANYLYNVGDHVTLSEAARPESTKPAVVKDTCVDLLGGFVGLPEVQQVLRSVVEAKSPGYMKAEESLRSLSSV